MCSNSPSAVFSTTGTPSTHRRRGLFSSSRGKWAGSSHSSFGTGGAPATRSMPRPPTRDGSFRFSAAHSRLAPFKHMWKPRSSSSFLQESEPLRRAAASRSKALRFARLARKSRCRASCPSGPVRHCMAPDIAAVGERAQADTRKRANCAKKRAHNAGRAAKQ